MSGLSSPENIWLVKLFKVNHIVPFLRNKDNVTQTKWRTVETDWWGAGWDLKWARKKKQSGYHPDLESQYRMRTQQGQKQKKKGKYSHKTGNPGVKPPVSWLAHDLLHLLLQNQIHPVQILVNLSLNWPGFVLYHWYLATYLKMGLSGQNHQKWYR